MSMRACIAMAAVLAALAGCGGDGEGGAGEPAATPSGTTTRAEPQPPASTPSTGEEGPAEPEGEPRERTPASLADCIREAPGVADVIVKGRSSEDATYFADLVGGRVDVLGVTAEGDGAERSVFLFASAADAKEAAPGAGGGGFKVNERGSALVVAPPRADIAAIDSCLAQTRYSRG